MPHAKKTSKKKSATGAFDDQALLPFLREDLYKNKYPEDPIVPIAKCRLEFTEGRWRTIGPLGGRRTAKGVHCFIVQHGELFVQRPVNRPGFPNPAGHIDLAGGKPVQFAGEIFFGGRSNQRGVLVYWNDRTGHYYDLSRKMNPRIVPLLPIEDFEAFDYGG